jgi:hypothetical protein
MPLLASAVKVDITPQHPVWLDGMIRAHPSEGVHDPLYARVLILANSAAPCDMHAVVSVDVCGLDGESARTVRDAVRERTGIPAAQMIIAATHTHSGPATVGFLNPRAEDYTEGLLETLSRAIVGAATNMRPAAAGCASGTEDTISHYRRLLARDGHVVMNWEPYSDEEIVGPLGAIDPELGVLRVTAAEDVEQTFCLLYNHAGHPNVMSGDNYLVSADYPGVAERLLEARFGGIASFLNGAQGTMDIDGLRDRDWEGVERLGRALAEAVADTLPHIALSAHCVVTGASARYSVPARQISDEEWTWAQAILRQTGGAVRAVADGVGDDYKAVQLRALREAQGHPIPVVQVCIRVGDCALLSFPGELFTEIGQAIKRQSPFPRTYIVGLANGYVGYIPTRQAVAEGGYAVETRRVAAAAEDIVVEQSLALLRQVFAQTQEE